MSDEYAPLDLDRIEADWRGSMDETRVLGELGMAVYDTVPDLIAALRDARAEIDRWKALPVRWEYAIGDGNWPPHPDVITTTDRPFACQVGDTTGHPVFGRRVHVGDFEKLQAEAPF